MATTFSLPEMEEIKDVLWESITTALVEIEFRFEDQSAERPAATGNPYGTLKIISGPTQVNDFDEERFANDGAGGLLVETVGQRELMLSVNTYRAGAGTLMSKLQKLFNSRKFREGLYLLMRSKYEKELVVVEALSSQDLTSLVQSDYEERFQMDVRLRTISSMIEDVDPIDEVTVDGAVVNEAEEIVDEGKTTIKIP